MCGPEDGDPYWSLGALTVLKVTDRNTGGAFSMIEEWIPAGSSPPMHVPREDNELFYVLDGAVTFEIDGERLTASAGSTVFAPHGRPHTSVTDRETHWLVFAHDPGLEQLWASVGRPAESWTIPDGSEAEMDAQTRAVMEQLDRYGIEIAGDLLTPDDAAR